MNLNLDESMLSEFIEGANINRYAKPYGILGGSFYPFFFFKF